VPPHTRSRNFLQLPLVEFKRAIKVFSCKRLVLGPALLAYEHGFLSIESGEVAAVMRAEGEWHGRATFSGEVLRAIATVPPGQDPLPIAYADGHLLIGSMTIACHWQSSSQALIDDLANPSLIDLLALSRTLPRAEMMGSERGKDIKGAVGQAEQRIRKAAAHLVDLGISEGEIRALVERKVAARLKPVE
jgi:hypothetical protein